jgi:hypothetical protein
MSSEQSPFIDRTNSEINSSDKKDYSILYAAVGFLVLVVVLVIGYNMIFSGAKKPMSQWTTSVWTECSAPCGNGMQTRTSSCIDGTCDPLQAPLLSQACNNKECFQYKGCYKDNPGKRVLQNGKPMVYVDKNTCYNTAKTANSKYFGMQYRMGTSIPGHAECWHGSTPFDTLGIGSGCVEGLGGGNENAVYEILG